MTVQINVDERMWAEAVRIARDLNVDQEELFVKTLTENLNELKRKRRKADWIAEAERKHKESYEKVPQCEEEFSGWQEIQVWGDE